MADINPNPAPVDAAVGPTCRHLRSNGMYLFSDAWDATDDDDSSSSSCWCSRTMKGFGPDDDMVGRRECRDASRSCHEPL